MRVIHALNSDPTIHGILVQLPLPQGLDEREVTEAIDARKDVDGFHSENIGRLAKRGDVPLFEPCTPKGCMVLLEHAGMYPIIPSHPYCKLILKNAVKRN
jgi:5,10-methylene-tetrahydrofolate dehydrogenase/methenyl tetrahydrofolate cyclohydrolase